MGLLLPFIREHFDAVGLDVPSNIRLTCGFPSKSALGQKKRRIGECWDQSQTTDKHHEICVSPLIADPIKVGGILVHEIIHATIGCKHGHKKPFAMAAEKVGLTKPWTATGETEELKKLIQGWVDRVGPYPHGALTPAAIESRKQKGRLLLLECECGLKIRSTAKWIDRYGEEWPCPCGKKLKAQLESEDGEDDE